MKRDRLSILLLLAMSFLLVFSYISDGYDPTTGANDSATRENLDGDREGSPDDLLDYGGVTALLKLSSHFLKGYFLGFLSGFSFPTLRIHFSPSILRC